LDRRVLGE